MSIRSRLARQSKNKLFSNNEQLYNAIDLSPINFGVILPLTPNGIKSINAKISRGTLDCGTKASILCINVFVIGRCKS